MHRLVTVQHNLAHIFDSGAGISAWWFAIGGAVMALLIIEHYVVAGVGRALVRQRCHRGLAALVVIALIALVAPVSDVRAAGAQSQSALLPDLVSDPPRPSFFNQLNTPDGGTRLVVTFDGYVHNVGEGALDVVGNPQDVDGMRQRVQNGAGWEEVGAPTVRFETDDGHNHFHLIEAIEYVLWNELQGIQTAIGSKVGFCLVDSQQMAPGSDQSYSEELDNFCQEDNPQATVLRMGISSGWRDIYDATTTLQWVDVSNVAPGRYWIGAITDPNDEILESNETNNDLIFSTETIAIPGFSPREQQPIAVGGDSVEFVLESTTHGSVTHPIYVIEQGPSTGTLDVPIGADVGSPTVRYFPKPGFTGTDEIVFSVHDASSPYPFDPPAQTLTFQVDAESATALNSDDNPDSSMLPSLIAPSTFFETEVGQASTVQIESTNVAGGTTRMFAVGLPAGLVADADTGVISGVAVEDGIFNVALIALGATPADRFTLDVTWIVNPSGSSGGLNDVIDQSSPRGELTRLRLGTNALGLRFEADGLPPGLSIEETAPAIAGTPTEAGTYDIIVRQLDANQVAAEIEFTWTIRATTDIEFAL